MTGKTPGIGATFSDAWLLEGVTASPSPIAGPGAWRAGWGPRWRVAAVLGAFVVNGITPYLGLQWSAHFGETADLRRAAGEDDEEWRWVAGVRAWF